MYNYILYIESKVKVPVVTFLAGKIIASHDTTIFICIIDACTNLILCIYKYFLHLSTQRFFVIAIV